MSTMCDTYSQLRTMDGTSQEATGGSVYFPGANTMMDETKQQEISKEERKKTMKNIMKNVILISVAFLMIFNAYQGLARLQSTLNLEEGIGKGILNIFMNGSNG